MVDSLSWERARGGRSKGSLTLSSTEWWKNNEKYACQFDINHKMTLYSIFSAVSFLLSCPFYARLLSLSLHLCVTRKKINFIRISLSPSRFMGKYFFFFAQNVCVLFVEMYCLLVNLRTSLILSTQDQRHRTNSHYLYRRTAQNWKHRNLFNYFPSSCLVF
jgi:hypothetical protein